MEWAALGTGTGIRVPAVTPTAISIATLSIRTCCRNGSGPSAIPSRRRSCVTRPLSRSASTSSETSSSASASSKLPSMRRTTFGQCALTRADVVSALRHRRCRQPVGHQRATLQGLSSFKGKWYHTSQWPNDGVDFTAKRVGVVGTGATAVQAIPEIAQQAKHLTVFQRTPNFCVPARNGKVDPEVTKARKADYSGGASNASKNSFFGLRAETSSPSRCSRPRPEEREKRV